MMRSRGSEGRLRWRHSGHAVPPRHKGLCLGIEGMISVIASRNRVLAFRIMRVNIGRQLAICIRNANVRGT